MRRSRPSTLRRGLMAALAVLALNAVAQAAREPDADPPRMDPRRLGEAGPQAMEPRRLSETGPQAVDPKRLNEAAPQANEAPDAARERAVQRLIAQARSSQPGSRATARSAAWLLGLLALHGLAMPQDRAQAQAWFERARQLGHPLAPAGLAWCAIDGCTGPARPAAARQWLAPLRKTDPALALYLDWLLEARLAPLQLAGSDVRDPSSIPVPRRDLLLNAAKAGDAHAQNELGIESAKAGRLQEAVDHFRAAARRSPTAAANAVLIEQRLQPNASRPAQRSQAEQWFFEGQRYHRGEGVPSNYAEAIRLYRMAAANGSARAQRMLELIFSRPAPNGGIDIAWMQQVSRMEVLKDGAVTLLPPSAPAALQRDPSPLYDLVPPEWRKAGTT